MSRQLQKTSARLFQNNPRGLKSPAKVIVLSILGGEQFMKSIQKTWMIHGHFGVRIPWTDFHLPVWGWPGTWRKSSPLNCLGPRWGENCSVGTNLCFPWVRPQTSQTSLTRLSKARNKPTYDMWIFQPISVLISCQSFRGKRWKIPVKNDVSFISYIIPPTSSSQTDTSQIHGNSTCVFILKINHLRLSICCTASPFIDIRSCLSVPVPKV